VKWFWFLGRTVDMWCLKGLGTQGKIRVRKLTEDQGILAYNSPVSTRGTKKKSENFTRLKIKGKT